MKINLGKKCTCASCSNKFYDLGEKNPICTKCGHVYLGADENAKKVDRVDMSILDELLEAHEKKAGSLPSAKIRFVGTADIEDIDELSILEDDLLEEDHQHFDMESDGDATDYMNMDVMSASLVDKIDDGYDDYEERLS